MHNHTRTMDFELRPVYLFFMHVATCIKNKYTGRSSKSVPNLFTQTCTIYYRCKNARTFHAWCSGSSDHCTETNLQKSAFIPLRYNIGQICAIYTWYTSYMFRVYTKRFIVVSIIFSMMGNINRHHSLEFHPFWKFLVPCTVYGNWNILVSSYTGIPQISKWQTRMVDVTKDVMLPWTFTTCTL